MSAVEWGMVVDDDVEAIEGLVGCKNVRVAAWPWDITGTLEKVVDDDYVDYQIIVRGEGGVVDASVKFRVRAVAGVDVPNAQVFLR